MASRTQFLVLFVVVAAEALVAPWRVSAGDPDLLSDFLIPPEKTASVDGSFFTFNVTRSILDAPAPAMFKLTKVTAAEFPALSGQSVSYAILQYPTQTPNGLHIHPRASELLFLVQGKLKVGFVDTTNKLFSQTLKAGDIYVFPKGLIHYQYNPSSKIPALAISAFGSSNPGTVSIPNALFTTGINDEILAKALKADLTTIQTLKAGLAPKA